MDLYIAGGCGEHGRNCFMVQTGDLAFLTDCGIMASESASGMPRLCAEQIAKLQAVFLTHSHADHSGALPWLWRQGFHGTVIATQETLEQLPFTVPGGTALGELCPNGRGSYRGLSIQWGRSGHCLGSVWYHFSRGNKSIFFSGDYTEHTLVHRVDLIRDRWADVAVLDCAYGRDETAFSVACAQLSEHVSALLHTHGLLLLPVPKNGRGLELLTLLAGLFPKTAFYGDSLFLNNCSVRKKSDFWFYPADRPQPVARYAGQQTGIVFVSDPQLRTDAAQNLAARIMAGGGRAVMTGTVEPGTPADALLRRGLAVFLRYPVHLNMPGYQHLLSVNHFSHSIPYHSPDAPRQPASNSPDASPTSMA